MGVISGRKARFQGTPDGGAATVVPTFRSATITKVSGIQELVHAGTRGGRQRFAGVKDWNGSYEEYALVPTFFPGAEVEFIGSIDGTKGYKGAALVTQTVITIPVGTKGSPTVVGTFRGIEALDDADTTAVALPTVVAVPSTEGICVQLAALAAEPVYANQDGTNEIVITLSIEDQPFHHCGSSGVMDALEGLWDANVTYKRYVDDINTLPTEGDPYHVRIPIEADGSPYYQFEYMRVGDLSDIVFNRESGELLNVSIPLMMSMIETIGATVTVGSGVTIPAGTVWRPVELT